MIHLAGNRRFVCDRHTVRRDGKCERTLGGGISRIPGNKGECEVARCGRYASQQAAGGIESEITRKKAASFDGEGIWRCAVPHREVRGVIVGHFARRQCRVGRPIDRINLQDAHCQVARGGLVSAIANARDECVVAGRGGEVAREEAADGVDREAGGAVCRPSVVCSAAIDCELNWRDCGELFSADDGVFGDRHAVFIDGGRVGPARCVFRHAGVTR